MNRDIEHAKRLLNDPLYNESFDKLAESIFNTWSQSGVNDVESLTYPSRYKYFLVLDGEIIRRSNSWATIEQAYVDECESRHGGGTGRMLVGKHKLVDHVITEL